MQNQINMKNSVLGLLIASFVVFISCSPGKKPDESTPAETTEKVAEPAEIHLTPVTSSPTFPEAKLTLNNPEAGAALNSGSVHFSYTVENYELTAQTEDADIKQCANSAQGQHIHLILNNQPYFAHYEAEFDRELEDGHYVALSFLSRSYHESLKSPDAFVIEQFTVGETEAGEADLTAQHLFYSRPKGEYKGDDTKKILLDFFLVNTDLSEDGNKVRATINEQEFMISQWVPHFVEGLPMGENTFKLELLDQDGNLIPGPFNSVERTVILSE